MLQRVRISPNAQANIYAAGLTYVYVMAIVGAVVGLVAVIWCVFQIVMLMLTSIVECASIIGTLYNGADPLVKLLILCAIGYAASKVVRRVRRTK